MRLMCWLVVVLAAALSSAKEKPANGVIQHETLEQYLSRMQPGTATFAPSSPGSLWLDSGRFANTVTDYKALHVGDLITIVVAQDITANNTGSVSSARNFNANSGISSLPGKLNTGGIQNLLAAASSSSLAGKGQAETSSSMRTSLAGRVVAVLPQGTLVIEAERRLTMNNERQTLLLRGLVRPGDVGPNNIVASNAIGNLELELKGKGVISEGNRPLNLVIRTILRILTF